MIYPNRESEKAISGYALTLTTNIRKSQVDIEDVTYTAGKPLTLFNQLSKIRNFDSIHIQHEYNLLGKYGLPFFWTYLYLGLFKKNKLITTMHTVLSQKENFKGSIIKTIARKVLYFFQNRIINWTSDVIVVHANFFKDILIKEYGVKASKIEVIPQGIIEDVPNINKEKAKKKFNLSGPVYIIMGGFVPDHGADIIIKRADKIGATVLIVANPTPVNDRNKERTESFLNQNQDYVKNNKLDKFVRFDISDITDKKPEWWEYFAASDLVLLSYRGGIGSGIFAHAMAAGKPVIASDIQFFREISQNFDCVKIAKDDDEYPKIIHDAMKKSNYQKMKKGCEKYLKMYGLSVIAKKYKDIYLK